MSAAVRNIVRLAVDPADQYRAPVNIANGGRVRIARGKDVQFEIGVFNRSKGSSIATGADGEITGWQGRIEAYQTIFIEIWDALTRITVRYVMISSSSFASCTAGEWDDTTSQHALITATATETAALTAAVPSGTEYWMVISALTADGQKITLSAGTIEAIEDGGQYAGVTVPVGNPAYPTRDELVAIIQALQRDFTVISPDGSRRRKIGVTNDGEPEDLFL